MTTAAQSVPKMITPMPIKASETAPLKRSKELTWQQFKNRYLSREDGYTYEWVNGKAEKTLGTMDISQFFIWLNIDQFFRQFIQKHQIYGSLVTEVDVFLQAELHRRPDIAYLTHAQIREAVKNPFQIPSFVVEIISPNDKANRVSRKVQEYLEAGVQVVWNIYPTLAEIHVVSSDNTVHIKRGDDLCSADPAIPGFEMKVSDILKCDDEII